VLDTSISGTNLLSQDADVCEPGTSSTSVQIRSRSASHKMTNSEVTHSLIEHKAAVPGAMSESPLPPGVKMLWSAYRQSTTLVDHLTYVEPAP